MSTIYKKNTPIVWTIGHSDSSGGTGVQADLHTFQDYGVYGGNVITSIVAQNSFASGYALATERKSVVAQINALDSDIPAKVIKVAAIPELEILESVGKYLEDFDFYYKYRNVIDPKSTIEEDAKVFISMYAAPLMAIYGDERAEGYFHVVN